MSRTQKGPHAIIALIREKKNLILALIDREHGYYAIGTSAADLPKSLQDNAIAIVSVEGGDWARPKFNKLVNDDNHSAEHLIFMAGADMLLPASEYEKVAEDDSAELDSLDEDLMSRVVKIARSEYNEHYLVLFGRHAFAVSIENVMTKDYEPAVVGYRDLKENAAGMFVISDNTFAEVKQRSREDRDLLARRIIDGEVIRLDEAPNNWRTLLETLLHCVDVTILKSILPSIKGRAPWLDDPKPAAEPQPE